MFREWTQRVGSAVPRGFSRYYILQQLKEQPHTGKEIIDSAIEASAGNWKPSPGLIYPLLGRLLDEGLIEESENGKYQITDHGKTILTDLEHWKMDAQKQMDTMMRLMNMGKFMGMDMLERVTILGNLLSSNASQMTNHEIEKYKKFLQDELEKIKEMDSKK
ncbi:MAG: PadR family transcriptional regulator [Thermoproteota archaeon]|jgi:DNA-binding PadR family transcriptional regulator|uniref:PadR family transcriptional regulator n=1 Tax=Candidatus Nitrosopelagicus brevis TaxID=1410606 RepID=A0A0A7V1E0_9ARCH|nr:PadR family transcriptional regulator [Candidatus Nitrosopelagicus brevis]MCH2618221.1 PadR family transcriptional regulator [Candidatus Nitrosopelagicus sp.]MEC7707693.1 PadR family transcriptional regulator [Thermoproteota archaeon]AJA92889.1 transcriptional regulator, PadR family [Candidatus Nitrosopelagicus brevis]MEC9087436.1 PadR family transcriptional regulator [Thermoproteota archaeon]MED5276246.1 PadR family transcriptional regulator [Thermoproteota archaeon]|tara:strand:+ start:42 stop:527 length:486 start_codon:yes stop_codon:yes gene_type:complete